MLRLLVALTCVLGFLPGVAQAVTIKNVRPCYGLPLGATRLEAKCMPGDIMFMVYDVDDLTVDKKTGKVNYDTILEVIEGDAKAGKQIFQKKTENELVPSLGGARVPGDLHVVMGSKQAPGKYAIRMTVIDKNASEKDPNRTVRFTYPFEVLKESFGFVQVEGQAVAFPGLPYRSAFWLANIGLDPKTKLPNVNMTIRIIDDKGTQVSATKIELPRDLPDGADLQKLNMVPFNYPMYLNRPGRFTVELSATDKVGGKSEKLTYPLTVLDVTKMVGGK